MKSLRRSRFGVPLFESDDLVRRFLVPAAVLGGVTVVGTIGYLLLGLSLLDAVYQTVITVSTVGFGETGEVTGPYRAFTLLLVVFGAGSVLFFASVLLETILEGRLTDEFRIRRMKKSLEALSGHVIVCGWGQVGRSISRNLVAEGADVVVVDRSEEVFTDRDGLFIVGDATADEVLDHAGITRARALVTALDTAADNVYVTLTGRDLNPDLFIVSRDTGGAAEPKLYKAGADRVVNPHERGGAHMAALVLLPNVADFLGEAMHDQELAVRLSEVEVTASSTVAGEAIAVCQTSGAIVLATRTGAGGFVHHPDNERVIEVGDVLIALGTEEELDALSVLVSG